MGDSLNWEYGEIPAVDAKYRLNLRRTIGQIVSYFYQAH